MIDIKEVEKLEKEAILQRIEREKQNQENNQKWHRDSHTKVLLEIEKAREQAEKEIPSLLKKIEADIAYTIKNKGTSMTFTCGEY